MNKDNLILNLSMDFAVKTVKLSGQLKEFPKDIIAKQLIRSGTSIGANIWESQGAESRNDFIHKLKISAKEAEETNYWLELCKRLEYIDNHEELLNDLVAIKKVLSKIISTSKSKKLSAN